MRSMKKANRLARALAVAQQTMPGAARPLVEDASAQTPLLKPWVGDMAEQLVEQEERVNADTREYESLVRLQEEREHAAWRQQSMRRLISDHNLTPDVAATINPFMMRRVPAMTEGRQAPF